MKRILFFLLIFIQAKGMEAPPSAPTELDIKLVEAVHAGKLNEAELLLFAGANPNIQIRLWGSGPQMTALQVATRVPDIRMYHLIKNNGGNPGTVDALLMNVLEANVFADPQQQKKYDEMKQAVIVDLIADPRTNLNAYPTYSPLNPLSWAVSKKNEGLINSLLATKRVDVNAENVLGQTAFDFAKTKKIRNIIEEAGGRAGSLKRKVPTAKSQPTVIHATPMQRSSANIPVAKPAATVGQKRKESEPWASFTAEPFKVSKQEPVRSWPSATIDWVFIIISAISVNDIARALDDLNRVVSSPGFDINKVDADTGQTILSYAIQKNALPIVLRIVAIPELNINYKDNHGRTALMHAFTVGNVSIVSALLGRQGLLINEIDNNGDTALDYFWKLQRTPVSQEIAKLLRSRGARTGTELRTGSDPRLPAKPARTETTQFAAEIYAKLGLAQSANPHQVLAVSNDATQEQIKAAFKAKTLQWHPDRNSDPMAKEVIQLINWAYKQIGPK